MCLCAHCAWALCVCALCVGICVYTVSVCTVCGLHVGTGAGDRLGLVDEASGECLPAAMLPYSGRTMMEGLIRCVCVCKCASVCACVCV